MSTTTNRAKDLHTKIHSQVGTTIFISTDYNQRTNDPAIELPEKFAWHIGLAPVVQRLDNAIRRINHYPADKC